MNFNLNLQKMRVAFTCRISIKNMWCQTSVFQRWSLRMLAKRLSRFMGCHFGITLNKTITQMKCIIHPNVKFPSLKICICDHKVILIHTDSNHDIIFTMVNIIQENSFVTFIFNCHMLIWHTYYVTVYSMRYGINCKLYLRNSSVSLYSIPAATYETYCVFSIHSFIELVGQNEKNCNQKAYPAN